MPVYTSHLSSSTGAQITGSTDMSGSLHITGSASITGSLLVSGSSTLTVYGPSIFNADQNANKDFQVKSAGNANMLYVDSSANAVGVGTATPTYSLDIDPASASALRVKNTTAGLDVNCAIENTGDASDDGVLMSYTVQAGTGDPSIRFAVAGNETWSMGIDNSDNDKLKISQASTLHTDTRLTLAGNKVGIGVTDPDTTLEVFNAGTQLKLSYDASDAATFAVADGGDLTINASGGDITLDDNVTVSGNLTVSGTTTTINSTVTTIADPLMELNTGASSNSNDLGFVFERGSTGNNACLIWDESADGFAVGTTTATGTSTGNMTFAAAPFEASTIAGTTITTSGAIELGHASDTTIARASSGQITVEGTAVILAGAVTGITSLLATDIKIGEDNETKIDFETADEIHFYAANAEQVYVADGVFGPQTDSDVDLGTTGVRWKDAFVDTVTTTGTITSGGAITSNAGIVVDNITIDGTEIDLSSGDLTLDVAGDIILNADGGDVSVKDDSAIIAVISNQSGQGELRLHEAANYVGFKAPALSANKVWTLPSADGSDGQQLTTNGSGVLSWAAAGSSGGDGSMTSVKLNNSAVGGADIVTLDFSSNFTASESPDTEIQIGIAAAQTTITSIFATDVKIGEDDQTKIDFETADEIHFYAANAQEMIVQANVVAPGADDGTALGDANQRWSDLFLASGAVINFDNGDVTLTHSSNTLTAAGGTVATAALTTSTIVASGIVKTDDTTNATSTTDGSLQTDGGLSVVLDAVFGDDVALLSDAAVLNFGANSEIKLTHVHDTGLLLTDAGGSPTLQFHDANESISSDGGHLIFTSNGVSFDFPSADGSDGQQLTTDGNGVLTWAAAGTASGAQTAITTILNANTKIGRDSQNLIDFATTDNKIIFRVNNVNEVELVENALTPVTSDGVALGTSSLMWSDIFLASGAVANFNNGDVTLTHSSNALTVAGGTFATAALTASTIVASGIVKTDDATDATSATDGSLQTDGGLSVVKDAIIGNDVYLLSDSAVLGLGAGKDATFTHDGTTGLTIAANPITLDSAADLVLDAGGGDFNFKVGGTEILRITNSSSDVIIKPIVDAKDLIFQQRDGTEVARVEDNGTFNVVTAKLAINGTAITSTAAELNVLDAVARGKIIYGNASGATALLSPGNANQVLTSDGTDISWADVTASSIAADDIAAGDAAVTIGNGSTNADVTLDSGADIVLDAAGGNIEFKDGGTLQLTLDMDGTAGEQIIQLNVDSDDLVFKQYDGTEVLRLDDDGSVYVKDNLSLKSDAAVLKFGANEEVTLTHVHDKGLILEANGLTAMPEFELRNTNADATGARLLFNKELSSNQEADNDVLGVIDFVGQDSDDNDTIYAAIEATSADVTANTEDGALKFTTLAAGSAVDTLLLESGVVKFPLDNQVLSFGADGDVSIAHNADKGLTIQQTATGDNHHTVLTLASPEGALAINETVASIEWKSDDSGGTDANEVCAAIDAVARANFSSSVNNASLVFRTAASEIATAKMELDSAGSLLMLLDGQEIMFGVNKDISLIHDHDQGLKIKNNKLGDNNEVILTLEAAEEIIGSGETVGSIQFKPNDSDGTDGAEVCAAIDAVATANFAADSNATKLVFRTGESEAATAKMEIEEDGDLNLLTDNMTISFGANEDITLTHVHDAGLTITNNIASTDNRPVVLELKSEENAILSGDEIGVINFRAGDSGGTDAIEIAAAITALATAEFTSSVNSTALLFKTGNSEAATEKMAIQADGKVGIGTAEVSATPDSRLEVVDDTAGNQLKLSYDASNGSTIGSDSVGNLVMTPMGSMAINSVAQVNALGTNQGTAADLTKYYNGIAGADGTKGVELPAGAIVGMTIHVMNQGASNLKVYPSSGQQINAEQANNGVAQSGGAYIMYVYAGNNIWNSFGAVTGL